MTPKYHKGQKVLVKSEIEIRLINQGDDFDHYVEGYFNKTCTVQDIQYWINCIVYVVTVNGGYDSIRKLFFEQWLDPVKLFDDLFIL